METQFIFDTFWKNRYVQMLISCGIDKTNAIMLIRAMSIAEDVTKNDICNLNAEQAAVVYTTTKETYPTKHETIMSFLNDYTRWRKIFAPYMDQPLQRDEILNSKEMKEIADVPLTPDDLASIITTALGDNTINVAAPGLCLAWMGYETPDMVQLKESDVDFDQHTVRNVHVPDPLWGVLSRYHETPSEKLPNRGSGKLIYKLPGDWLIKSTDCLKTTTECQVVPGKITVSVTKMEQKYKQIAGQKRRITVRLTQVGGMLYRLYEPWDVFTDEQFVDAVRFRGRTYDTYQMQSWRKKFTAYCLLREMREAT